MLGMYRYVRGVWRMTLQNFEGFAKYCECGEYMDVCEGWKCKCPACSRDLDEWGLCHTCGDDHSGCDL